MLAVIRAQMAGFAVFFDAPGREETGRGCGFAPERPRLA